MSMYTVIACLYFKTSVVAFGLEAREALTILDGPKVEGSWNTQTGVKATQTIISKMKIASK